MKMTLFGKHDLRKIREGERKRSFLTQTRFKTPPTSRSHFHPNILFFQTPSRFLDIYNDVTPYWTLFKQRGPLIYASSGVIKILEMSEKIFRRAINTDLSNIKKSILVYLVTEKLSLMEMFPHYLENSVLEDQHCTQLITIISGKYFESRIWTWSKNYSVNLKVKGGNWREKLSRTVIISKA